MPSNRVRPPLRQDEDSNDAGFTVLEVLVAFVLFAVLAGASTTAILNATAASNTSRDRVNAANIAEQDIQDARSLRYPNYPQPVAAHTVTVGSGSGAKKYTVTRTIPSPCPVSSDPDNPGIAWVPGMATSMQVITTVTWPGSTTGVTIATEMAC